MIKPSMSEYRAFVAERSIYPGSGTLVGATYCGLKMAGEAGELLEHVAVGSDKRLILKEAGDVLWYVIASERELNLNLAVVRQEAPDYLVGTDDGAWARALSIAVSKYTESLGKSMRDGNYNGGELTDTWRERLRDQLEMVLWCIAGVSNYYGKRLHEVAELNVSKLKDRDARGVTKGDGDER